MLLEKQYSHDLLSYWDSSEPEERAYGPVIFTLKKHRFGYPYRKSFNLHGSYHGKSSRYALGKGAYHFKGYINGINSTSTSYGYGLNYDSRRRR